jgi:two-component system, NtrC family, sensor kinase
MSSGGRPVIPFEAQLELHQRAMDASSCGITIADASVRDLPLIYVNHAFEQITGYAASDVAGKNCRFLQQDDRFQANLTTLRDSIVNGRSCTVLLRNYRRDNSPFWNELYMSPVYNPQGQLTHFVGVQTDVTARKQAEDALFTKQATLEQTLKDLRDTQAMLIHAERMNALGQMVAGIAHEINNPLSFVNSNLHSLRGALRDIFAAYDRLEAVVTETQLSDAQRQLVSEIHRDADLDYVRADFEDLLHASVEGLARVKAIVQALRSFARLDEADYKVASLQDCVNSALMIARGELRDRVQVTVNMDAVPEIRCYPAELNQVFLNIIVNAAQAIHENGTLTIEAHEAGAYVKVKFTDSGSGMPPDVQRNLFTPFFTTKPAGVGVGLGLAIAYKIVTEHHHGYISVESVVGQGSTFTVTLPKDLTA